MKISARAIAAPLLVCIATSGCIPAVAAAAATSTHRTPAAAIRAAPATRATTATEGSPLTVATASLESVATKASETGRNVAMSLIGLALAIASVVLAFRRDFKEAAAVFVVGLVCVLLASSTGETLLQDTVNALVG